MGPHHLLPVLAALVTEPNREKEQVALILINSHSPFTLCDFLLIIDLSELTFEGKVQETEVSLQYPCEGSTR